MTEETKRPAQKKSVLNEPWVTIEDNNGRMTSGPLSAAHKRAFPWLEAQAKAWVKAAALYAPKNVKTFIEEKESSKTPYREILKEIPDALYKPSLSLAEIDVNGKGTVTYLDNSEQVKTCTWKEYLTEIGPGLETEAMDLYCLPNPYARKEQTPEMLTELREYLKEQRAAGTLIRAMWLRKKSKQNRLSKLTPEEMRDRETALKTKGRWAHPAKGK